MSSVELTYLIDDHKRSMRIDRNTRFSVGNEECLAKKYNDATQSARWFNSGFAVIPCHYFFDFDRLVSAVQSYIEKQITRQLPQLSAPFHLEDYHRHVDDVTHHKILSVTRRISPEELNFTEESFLRLVGLYFGLPLKWNLDDAYDPQIIIRLNRPRSLNYNPVHKDIYQIFDRAGYIPKMVNIWIPICGVGGLTGLPVSPGSHLISEDQICRSKPGVLANRKYFNVNCIKSWGGDRSLITISPKYGEMLIFSSHLIHGFAKNYNLNKTRISLEFRLFSPN